MARPAKNQEEKNKEDVKVVEKSETFTKEDMIALAKEMAKEIAGAEIDKFKQEQKESAKKSIIDMNMLVKIKSNIDGKLIWSNSKTSTGVNILLNDFGSEDWITLAEAKDIDRWSTLFRHAKIYITEINSDDFELEDVVRFLGLSRLYGEDVISPENIEQVLSKEDMGAEKFNQLLENSKEIGETILEVAHLLKKKGKIKETYKIDGLKAKDATNNMYRL